METFIKDERKLSECGYSVVLYVILWCNGMVEGGEVRCC